MIQLAVIAAAPARFDHHIFLEAPHGTELARYGSPGASEIGITGPTHLTQAGTEFRRPGQFCVARDGSRPIR